MKAFAGLVMWLAAAGAQNVVVTVQGRLEGEARDGYVSYTGIPYGTINSTEEQFKSAGLAPFWLGIREPARASCSPSSRPEDCLILDVHVPATGASPWPVLAWVRGTSGQYHPRKLVQQGIIVVVVHHRLGPSGFLCLQEESIPGNAAVKDVVAALRWVRDNIAAFRGNPSKVVVGGQGFGAAMAEAVTLPAAARGLYHGIIMQSGTILAPWAFNYDAKQRAQHLARSLRNDDDEEDDDAVLLNTESTDLFQKADSINFPYFPFGMCVEVHQRKGERLLTEVPINTLNAKKAHSVPMLIGHNSNEGYIFAYTLKQANALRRLARDISFLLPTELKFLNQREVGQVADQVKDMYFKRNVTMASVISYHSDVYFASHVHRTASLHAAAGSPVHLYQFSHVSSGAGVTEPGVKKTGAAHSDELVYLFGENDAYLDEEDREVQSRLLRLWSDFVKHLNPTPGSQPRWETASEHDPRLLDISTSSEMKPAPRARNMRFWQDIYDRYYYGRHV